MQKAQLPGGAVSLRRVLKKARFLSGDVVVRSCAFDWRACQPGDVFFALCTADGDGHDSAEGAIRRGATAVVGERLLPLSVPQVLVPDSRVALGRVCQALAGNPSRELTTVGVAGSAGKTSVCMLLAAIFEAAGQTAGVMSSFGHSDSLTQSPPPTATPTSAEFADWLRRMHLARCAASIVEFRAQALAERRTSGVALDIALITNIKNERPAQYNSAAAYQKIIRRIYRHLKPGGVAIVNADDHRSRNWVGRATTRPLASLTYAIHSAADVTASVIERSASEQTFLLSVGSHVAPVRTQIIGDPHVSNCLAAASTAIALGIDVATIVRGLESVERLPGRMDRIECGQPYSVFVDAAREPESMAQTIKSIRQVTRGRVRVVFGASGPTEPARRALLGRVLERGAHQTLITTPNDGDAASLGAAHDYLDGFERPHRAHIIPSRRKAIEFALAQAQPGDAVLIAGRNDLGNPAFEAESSGATDRQIAMEILYGRSVRRECPRFRVVG